MAETQQQEITILRRIRYPTSEWYVRSDGIIMVLTPDNIHYTINNAKLFVTALREITGGIPHLVLTVPGKHMNVDKEARSFMATPQALQDVLALASIVSGRIHRVIGNLFLTVDKPVKPVRLFENINEAIEWLKTQKISNH